MAKILLVEDDNNLREIYGARLVAEGHQIVSAKDGEEALAIAVKEKPELIISDVMMPRISGFDMLDILRNAPETKDTKVIIMTALSQVEDKARADQLGADLYLVKSQVTLEDVAKAVRDVLDGGSEEAGENQQPSVNPPENPTPPPTEPTSTPTEFSDSAPSEEGQPPLPPENPTPPTAPPSTPPENPTPPPTEPQQISVQPEPTSTEQEAKPIEVVPSPEAALDQQPQPSVPAEPPEVSQPAVEQTTADSDASVNQTTTASITEPAATAQQPETTSPTITPVNLPTEEDRAEVSAPESTAPLPDTVTSTASQTVDASSQAPPASTTPQQSATPITVVLPGDDDEDSKDNVAEEKPAEQNLETKPDESDESSIGPNLDQALADEGAAPKPAEAPAQSEPQETSQVSTDAAQQGVEEEQSKNVENAIEQELAKVNPENNTQPQENSAGAETTNTESQTNNEKEDAKPKVESPLNEEANKPKKLVIQPSEDFLKGGQNIQELVAKEEANGAIDAAAAQLKPSTVISSNPQPGQQQATPDTNEHHEDEFSKIAL